jgi:hypothetical protein
MDLQWKNGVVKVDHGGLTPMGRQMREQHFLFEKSFVNLNHGTFHQSPPGPRSDHNAHGFIQDRLGRTHEVSETNCDPSKTLPRLRLTDLFAIRILACWTSRARPWPSFSRCQSKTL